MNSPHYARLLISKEKKKRYISPFFVRSHCLSLHHVTLKICKDSRIECKKNRPYKIHIKSTLNIFMWFTSNVVHKFNVLLNMMIEHRKKVHNFGVDFSMSVCLFRYIMASREEKMLQYIWRCLICTIYWINSTNCILIREREKRERIIETSFQCINKSIWAIFIALCLLVCFFFSINLVCNRWNQLGKTQLYLLLMSSIQHKLRSMQNSNGTVENST